MVQQVEVPESALQRGLLPAISYQDAFRTPVSASRSAEEWVRLVVAGAPPGLLPLVRQVHRALGLRLGPPSAERPLGWSFVRREDDLCILAADGPRGGARITCEVRPGEVLMITQVQFDGTGVRAVWPLVAPLHRGVARLLLSRAEAGVGAA